MEKPTRAARPVGSMAIIAATILAIALIHTLWLAVQDLSEQVMEQGRVIESLLEAEHDRLERELQQTRRISDQVIPISAAPAHDIEPAFVPLDVPLAEDLQLLVWEQCGQHETILTQQEFFDLVLKVMWNESRHQVDVTDNHNRNGSVDRGPMQINSISWEQLAAEGLDINDAEDNITAGIRFLADYLIAYEDVEYALTAYAFGPTGAREKGGKSQTARNILNINLKEVSDEGKI